MRFSFLFAVSGLVAAAFALLEESSTAPELVVTATFAEDNPFSQIVNGERNQLNLLVENTSEQNVTLVSVAASLHDPSTDSLVKNLSTIPLGFPLFQGSKIQVPYQFHSEIRTGEIRLLITLTHALGSETFQTTAFDDVLTVVEPPVSLLDYRVISTYLITAAGLGALAYFSFISFFPSTSSHKSTTRKQASNAATAQAQTPSGGYDDEWIPEHHRKKAKGGKRENEPSGDERSGISGNEAVASDGGKQRRKARKA